MSDSYSALAFEYYDSDAHPTCSNFRLLSEQFIWISLLELWSESNSVTPLLEVGAGRSIVAPLFERTARSMRGITIQDISPSMLQHSIKWLDDVEGLICDARSIPLQSGSQAVVVSSLGDPYNDEKFVEEVARLLIDGGSFFITTPSRGWASAFRDSVSIRDAEFILRDGRSHSVPSITWDPGDYIRIVEALGFTLREFRSFEARDVVGHLSPKLRVAGFSGAVLDGYWFRKHAN